METDATEKPTAEAVNIPSECSQNVKAKAGKTPGPGQEYAAVSHQGTHQQCGSAMCRQKGAGGNRSRVVRCTDHHSRSGWRRKRVNERPKGNREGENGR